ncbi:ead/Ea22-like family protein [Escherichia coli]|uniref:ead/Ea22-like family protein n=1 Tax=Citrobacter freundii TaxID=546 RepID=UPI002B3B1803|nr:ead/Ea22-like family protein [Escherichia coli]HCB2574138.1 ead/Ea22-like family protein [Citrobacter freundii]HDL4945215.1 ead/Ea22-like family protein [Escherichia coli]
MSNIDKQALNQEKIEWLNKLADMEYCKSNPGHWLMSLKDTNMLAKLALRSVALLDELEAAEKRIAELEANKCKPVMFIDGDISPADADKLAAVIREFNEETETPAARMARIIRENPHPTNMCDMPAAGIGKGE